MKKLLLATLILCLTAFSPITGGKTTTFGLINEIPIHSPIHINKLERMSDNYGYRRHPITKRWSFHRGLDLVAPKSTNILSTCNGKVINTKQSRFGYGNRILIKHRYGYMTHYTHLDSIFVKKGQTIERGDTIGTLGSTGFSTGPHLHYEILKDSIQIHPMFIINNKNKRTYEEYFSRLIALEKK